LAKKAFVFDGTNWIDIAQSTADLSGYPALATNQFGFRNKIINGDFRINQRGYTSASNLASGSYGFDRWKSTFTNTTLTFTSAPQGQLVTINSGGSVKQIIERENMPAGTYVLSWTGTATGRVYNTGATPPSYAASPILVTIDGTANVEVEFTASGGTRTLQNVQLEAGNVRSAFEYRPIGTELALCQRYYWRWNTDGNQYAYYSMCLMRTGTTFTLGNGPKHPVTMRAVPQVSFNSMFGEVPSGGGKALGNGPISNNLSTKENVGYVVLADSNWGASEPGLIRAYNTTSAFVEHNAEL
jgi:hypothetical protein